MLISVNTKKKKQYLRLRESHFGVRHDSALPEEYGSVQTKKQESCDF